MRTSAVVEVESGLIETRAVVQNVTVRLAEEKKKREKSKVERSCAFI